MRFELTSRKGPVAPDGFFLAESTDAVMRGLALLGRKVGTCWALRSWVALWLIVAAGLFGAAPASAQVPGPPTGVLSALAGYLPFGGTGSPAEEVTPLFFPPYFGAEMRGRLLGIQTTKATLQTPVAFYDFKDSLGLSSTIALMEAMFRLQFSRFSVRLHITSKLSDYSLPESLIAPGPPAWNQFGFSDPNSGVRYRLGGDLDLVLMMRSRLGVCLDYDLDSPFFKAFVGPVGGLNQVQSIQGQPALTLGTYAVFNPAFSWCRYSVILEARGRWPVSDRTKVTEYEFAGGIKTPETGLGSLALRGGYRNTQVDMWGGNFNREVQFQWSGWFGELVYYY